MKLSVAIPCWSMNGKGRDMLEYNFNILNHQTFKEFEIVVTDHSEDHQIEHLCKVWLPVLDIKYIRNEEFRGWPAQNTNLGIQNCSGEYIKLLCQDDFLYGNDALEKLYNNVLNCNWLFSTYWHSNDRTTLYRRYTPYFNHDIKIVNTLGTPSALIVKNEGLPELDNNLKYMYDCEFYYQLYLKFGLPKILDEETMVNYLHENQTTTSIVNSQLSNYETEYIRRKYC